MNLLLLHESDRQGGARFRVRGDRARHIREVLGAEPGSALRAGLLDGPVGEAHVVSFDGDDVVLDADLQGAPPPPSGLALVLAVPRPKVLRRLLPQVAAMGVDRIVLLRTWRVEKPYLVAHVLRPEVVRPLLHEGMMQGRSTREPEVTVEPLFKPYVEDRLATDLGAYRRFVAHPGAATPTAALRLTADEPVAVVIGPEGGLVPYEIAALAAAGCAPVSIGDRTLHVTTAVISALAQLDLLRRIAR